MSANPIPTAPYLTEYMAAMDRTADFGLETPPRVLVAKDCVDQDRTMKALLNYFDRHRPVELVGQTVAINLAMMPILLEATEVPFQLTMGRGVGWKLGWRAGCGGSIPPEGREVARTCFGACKLAHMA